MASVNITLRVYMNIKSVPRQLFAKRHEEMHDSCNGNSQY